MDISRDKFVLAKGSIKEAEKLSAISLSFWQDAWRRLKLNKAAMIGLWVLAIILLIAIIAPTSIVNQKNEDGTVFKYDAAPIILDENGVEIAKERLAFLPPRVPFLENIGIFDGVAQIEIGSFDLLIGVLPKTIEFNELRKIQNKQALIEKIGIPYHPYDINFRNIYEDENGVLLADITIFKTGEELTMAYDELASEYTKYRQGNFEFISSGLDKYNVEMIKVKADYYEIKNIKNLYFWFGTDKLALDVWTRVWIGVRVSLIIAFASLILDFSVGIIYGTIAGFYGGRMIDTIMMRITEIVGSIPALVLMIIFISIQKPIGDAISSISPIDITVPMMRLIILILAMSLTGWIGVARVVRSQILKLRDLEFVLASRTLGASKARLMSKHLFPNIIGQIVVMATFTIPGAIFYEAFLTFIGLGLPIPMASLGVLVRDGYEAIQTIPEMLLIPASIMVFLMLSINLLANGLRDALDPRMR